jgi:hypothetical protein
MYHFAILYPSRKERARAIARLFALRYPNAPTVHDPAGIRLRLTTHILPRAAP